MRDMLERLQRALPEVSAWIDRLHSDYSHRATTVHSLPFSRLPRYFERTVLQNTKAVTVATIPFPPVSTYGLPEFEAMAGKPMAGITYRDMYFVHEAYDCEAIHFHELVHAIQWRTLGFDGFLLTYGAGILQYALTSSPLQAYANSPLEAAAFGLQAKFEQRVQLPGLTQTVVTAALRAREQATTLFRDNGLTMGA